MNTFRIWDILSGLLILFSGVNMFYGEHIHFFEFASDPRVKGAMMGVSMFLVSKFINGVLDIANCNVAMTTGFDYPVNEF